MHSCSETRERFTEFLLDGADCRSDEALSAQLRGCGECRNEFYAVRATLRITKRSSELSTPAEDYWTKYHAKLRQKIENGLEESHATAQRRKEKLGLSFAPLRLVVRTVPVPVPLIAAVIIAFVAVSAFAIFGDREPTAQAPLVLQVPVEVPVTQEKIITRVVYRDRRPPTQSSKQSINAPPKSERTFAKSGEVPAALEGFKPTEEVKLTVVKGGSRYEE
jgi:hypothetical protein